jgi:hypothetical protein
MESFKKRQKEMRRLERQRDKAAKRKEMKARKAAGITNGSDRDTETTENAATTDPAVALSTLDWGDPLSLGRRDLMEIRYLGFDQRQNSRVYRFDVRNDGRMPKEVSVTADVGVFRNSSVGIQEGPILSGSKLNADLQRGWEGEHELTAADVRAYADTKALAEAQRAAAHKVPRRRAGVPAETQQKSPWRNFGIWGQHMPFPRPSGYSFTAASIKQTAPAWGGIYGLSNSQAWIYIHAADDIRAALLDHVNDRNPSPDFRSVTGFTFELCYSAHRSQRCRRLIAELHPVVRGLSEWL